MAVKLTTESRTISKENFAEIMSWLEERLEGKVDESIYQGR